jgi:RNA polymerase sigma-70 factor, ECF subfamily
VQDTLLFSRPDSFPCSGTCLAQRRQHEGHRPGTLVQEQWPDLSCLIYAGHAPFVEIDQSQREGTWLPKRSMASWGPADPIASSPRLTRSWVAVLGTGGKQERVSRVNLTAADLVGVRRREPAAVTRVYIAYAPALFRFFMAAVGDRPTAEDLTGDVFKSAIEDLPRFRGPVEALGGWLFGIARHDLSDYRRRQARRLVQPLDELLEEAAAAGGAVDPEELALDRVEGDRVLAALRQLTPDQREVLLLRLVADLSAPEVAGILHKSTDAVKALQHRGLASLAQVLGVTNDTSSPEPQSLSSDPARLRRQGDGGEHASP